MKRPNLILGFAVFCMIAGMSGRASAGMVTISNDYWWPGELTMCIATPTGAEDCSKKQNFNGAGQGVVFQFTSPVDCPKSLSGHFTDVSNGGVKMKVALQPVNVGTGQDISNPSGGTPNCLDSSWKICRKRGTQGEGPMKDNDFGFCRK